MVSMAGGLELFIDGDGMDDEPIINSVLFWPTQSPKPDNLIGPELNSKCPRWSHAWRHWNFILFSSWRPNSVLHSTGSLGILYACHHLALRWCSYWSIQHPLPSQQKRKYRAYRQNLKYGWRSHSQLRRKSSNAMHNELLDEVYPLVARRLSQQRLLWTAGVLYPKSLGYQR